MDSWTMASTLAAVFGSVAAVAGVIYSAITFKKSFSKMSQSEQVRIVHDIGNNLSQAEDGVMQAWTKENPEDIKLKYMQYLNVWEWYSFLVNNDQITIPELIDHYKKSICDDYQTIFDYYPDLKDDKERYKEFKELCSKLECEKVNS